MRLKREIKCFLCTERMQFQYVCAKRWFENFRSGIFSVKDSLNPYPPNVTPKVDLHQKKVMLSIMHLVALEGDTYCE